MDETRIQAALADLTAIRRAVERVEGKPCLPRNSILGAEKVQQIVGLGAALLVVVTELLTGHINSIEVTASAGHPAFQIQGLINVAFALLLGLALLYWLPMRTARSQGHSYQFLLARHFQHLRNFSLGWDLAVKFVVVAFVVLGDRPECVAPLLSVFTADWLFQGRYFTLPTAQGQLLGAAAVIAATLQFYLGSSLIVVPAILFCVAGAISLWHLTAASSSQTMASADSSKEV